jgi:hypothetical protein
VKNRSKASANSLETIGDHIPQSSVLFPLLVVQGVFLPQVFDSDYCGHRFYTNPG